MLIRFLTGKEEAQLHLKDLKNGANTFEGCIRDIRAHTPKWLCAREVEQEFRKLVREEGLRMSDNKCPDCEKELECVVYTKWGQKVWNGTAWEEDEYYGEVEFRCPECSAKLDPEVLKKMDVI